MINYYLITKPGIILGNLITLIAGFLLASHGHLPIGLFISTLIGLTLIMASACVFNNYIDRQTDKKMQRTKNRPLATGLISGKRALVFATLLGILGALTLLLFTNLLATLVAAIGFFVYVVLYSMWKCRTVYGTAIGSIAGAVPPVVGYCAVSQHFDSGALILFAMLVMWQMPHFFAIALSHFDDYAAANIPVLPVSKGLLRTKIHMCLYILGFIGVAALLTVFNYTGQIYLLMTLGFGLVWFGLSLTGFKNGGEQIWGRRMFRVSLWVITIVCFSMTLDLA